MTWWFLHMLLVLLYPFVLFMSIWLFSILLAALYPFGNELGLAMFQALLEQPKKSLDFFAGGALPPRTPP